MKAKMYFILFTIILLTTNLLFAEEQLNPVEQHGQLKVEGSHIIDENNNVFQIKGMSTHGLAWFPDILNDRSFLTLKDDWNVNCIRFAMYVDENGDKLCYLKNPKKNIALMEKGLALCLKYGLYAIIDWHVLNPGDPSDYTEEAIEFFTAMSKKYQKYPNIIYEICNEPNGKDIDWQGVIRPYCEKVITAIRKNDKDAIIIAGTGTWSQDIDDALNYPLDDENVVYALHYYAATHGSYLRDRVSLCAENDFPIFVSEFGNCDASGNGKNDLNAATTWLELLDSLQISYVNWALGNKNEACCVFKPRTNLAAGNWSDDKLTESGLFIKNWYTKE